MGYWIEMTSRTEDGGSVRVWCGPFPEFDMAVSVASGIEDWNVSVSIHPMDNPTIQVTA